jgi:hypothetical protein
MVANEERACDAKQAVEVRTLESVGWSRREEAARSSRSIRENEGQAKRARFLSLSTYPRLFPSLSSFAVRLSSILCLSLSLSLLCALHRHHHHR